jgi:hypothetical protein
MTGSPAARKNAAGWARRMKPILQIDTKKIWGLLLNKKDNTLRIGFQNIGEISAENNKLKDDLF